MIPLGVLVGPVGAKRRSKS